MYFKDVTLICEKHNQNVDTVIFSKLLEFKDAILCEQCLQIKQETFENSYSVQLAQTYILEYLKQSRVTMQEQSVSLIKQVNELKMRLLDYWNDFNQKIQTLKSILEEWESQLNRLSLGQNFSNDLIFKKELEDYFARGLEEKKLTDLNNMKTASLEKIKTKFNDLLSLKFPRLCFEKLIEIRNEIDVWERIQILKKVKPSILDQPVSQYNQKQIACALQQKKNFLIVSCENIIKILQFNNGTLQDQQLILKGHTQQVQAIVASKNHNWFASCSTDFNIRTWKEIGNTKWESVLAVQEHSDKIYGLILNKAENCLISYGADSKILIWEVQCQHNIIEFKYALNNENTSGVLNMSLNPSETKLIATHGDATISFWKQSQGDTNWKFSNSSKQKQVGFRVCFIGNNQFIFQGKNGQMFLYQIVENNLIIIKNIPLNIKENDDEMLFPVIFDQTRQIIILKHNKFVYIMKRDVDGNILNNLKIECETKRNYGTITNDGRFLVIWKEQQNGNCFQVHKITYS